MPGCLFIIFFGVPIVVFMQQALPIIVLIGLCYVAYKIYQSHKQNLPTKEQNILAKEQINPAKERKNTGLLVLVWGVGFIIFFGSILAIAKENRSSAPVTNVSSEPEYPVLKEDGNSLQIISAEKIPLSQYKDTVGTTIWHSIEYDFDFVLRVKWAVSYAEGTSYRSINDLNSRLSINCVGSNCLGDRMYSGSLFHVEILGEPDGDCMFGSCYISDSKVPYVGRDDIDVATTAGTSIVYTSEVFMPYADQYSFYFHMFDDEIIFDYKDLSVGNR